MYDGHKAAIGTVAVDRTVDGDTTATVIDGDRTRCLTDEASSELFRGFDGAVYGEVTDGSIIDKEEGLVTLFSVRQAVPLRPTTPPACLLEVLMVPVVIRFLMVAP